MSEETKTTETTETQKQLLWANVPWGVVDQQKNIQVTGNVDPVYLSLVLAKQLQEKEEKLVTVEQELTELKKKVESEKVDTTTSDT